MDGVLIESDVLAINTVDDLRRLSEYSFGNRAVTPNEVTHMLKVCGAFWRHSGDPKDPHAGFTSGICSDGFIDVLRMLKYTNLCSIMAKQLLRKMLTEYEYNWKHGAVKGDKNWWVVGSDHAGATISFRVAEYMQAQHDFAEKGLDIIGEDGKPEKRQFWKRFIIEPHETVLQVEDLITTLGTLKAVRKGMREGNPHPIRFAKVVLTVVHYPPTYQIEDSEILYLVRYNINTWDQKECPLCRTGSARIDEPKKNWAELTGHA